MTTETLPGAPATVAPGVCSEHPDLELVTPERLYGKTGQNWYLPAGWDIPNVCPSPDHGSKVRGYRGDEPPAAARRCRWCGGPVYDPADGKRDWERSARKVYCIPNHRLRAHRAAARSAA
jgi:hypothetical protein